MNWKFWKSKPAKVSNQPASEGFAFDPKKLRSPDLRWEYPDSSQIQKSCYCKEFEFTNDGTMRRCKECGKMFLMVFTHVKSGHSPVKYAAFGDMESDSPVILDETSEEPGADYEGIASCGFNTVYWRPIVFFDQSKK